MTRKRETFHSASDGFGVFGNGMTLFGFTFLARSVTSSCCLLTAFPSLREILTRFLNVTKATS